MITQQSLWKIFLLVLWCIGGCNGCTNSGTLNKDKVRPAEEQLEDQSDEMIDESAAESDDFGDADANMEEAPPMDGGVSDDAAMDAMPQESGAAEQDSNGKGGIISSGIKAKIKKCKAIKNPRKRQRCLEQVRQKN